MIKQLLSILALSTVSVAPAFAELSRIGTDRYVADDANGDSHLITYVRQDHEGDVQLEVNINGNVTYYWVNCTTDKISVGGDDYNGWRFVDHRKMEGYYSDVACRK